VRGIGPKTAVELLNEFDTLQGIYQNLDKITNPRRKNLLETNKDNAMLSYELVGFDLKAPTPIDFEQFKYSEIDKAGLIDFCKKHGFRNLITKLEQGVIAAPPAAVINYEPINTLKITEFAKLYGKISILKTTDKLEISIDGKHFKYETKAKPQGNLFGDEEADKLNTLLSELKELLQDESVLKILFDAKNLISKHGLVINNFADISLMAYATGAGNIDCSLKGMGRYFFQDENAITAAVFEELYHKLLGMMNDAACFKIYHFLDLPLTNVIAQIEKRGVKIDALYLQNLSKEFI
jgi:DNA polymerase-1